jgi:hypothetical protein
MTGQFENEANSDMRRAQRPRRLWINTGGKVDAIIADIGMGGTFTGIAEALKPRSSGFRMITIEPAACQVQSQDWSRGHNLQGLSSGHVPKILHTNLIDEVINVEDYESIRMAREVAHVDALAIGTSSGAWPSPPFELPSASRWRTRPSQHLRRYRRTLHLEGTLRRHAMAVRAVVSALRRRSVNPAEAF